MRRDGSTAIAPGITLVDRDLRAALESAAKAEDEGRSTRLSQRTLDRLIGAGLVYAASYRGSPGVPDRTNVHLTARGCHELGRDPGIRR